MGRFCSIHFGKSSNLNNNFHTNSDCYLCKFYNLYSKDHINTFVLNLNIDKMLL